MRAQGIGAWETLDAGPQVKILCLAGEVQRILDRLRGLPGLAAAARVLVAHPGEGPVVREIPE